MNDSNFSHARHHINTFIKSKLSLKANKSQFSHFKTIIFDNVIKINMAWITCTLTYLSKRGTKALANPENLSALSPTFLAKLENKA